MNGGLGWATGGSKEGSAPVFGLVPVLSRGLSVLDQITKSDTSLNSLKF